MNKRASYEIDFKGNDSASAVARKIVSSVTSAQKSASASIQAVNADLRRQSQLSVGRAAQVKRSSGEISNQARAVREVSSAYSKAYTQTKSDLKSGLASQDEVTRSIETQRQRVADLSAQYRELKASKASASSISSKKKELDEERQALSGTVAAAASYKKETVSIRSQIAVLRGEMERLRLEGKEDTAEYEQRRQEMERLKTTYREVSMEQKVLSSGSAQISGVVSGLQGLMGIYSVGSGIVSMFTTDNEKLMKVQTKMQSVMAVMMGAQQVANTLHSTSAFRIVTCRKVTELWTTAQNRLTVSIGMSTVAAKAWMATLTMGASVIAAVVIGAISRLISKHREQKKAQEEASKAEEDAQKSVRQSVAASIASQLASYRKLQQQWKQLGGNATKQQKFIKDNASEFKKLGVSVRTVKDAENLLVSGESAFVESLKRRAMAAAAMELASKKYQAAIEKMLEAEDAKKGTDKERRQARSKAEDVYLQKAGAAKNPIARGAVAKQHDSIVGQAYATELKAITDKRVKEYNDAAKKEMAAGDRYFEVVDKYNKQADAQLKGGGITPSGGGDPGSKAGSIDAIEKKIQALTTAMKAAGATERAELQKQINAWQKKLDAVNLELEALGVPADPQTLQELDTAISYYDKLLKIAGDDEREQIQQSINGYKKKKTAIEDSLKALSVPANPKTLEEYGQVISALEGKLSKASASERAGIQATINAYQREEDEIRARLALAATPAVLESLADYEQAISACESVLQYANDEERANIQRTINEYRKKKEAIEDSLQALDVPAEPKSLEDFDKVISALEAKLQKAGDTERAGLQQQIDLWNAKKQAITESLQLAGMDDLQAMVQNGLGLGNTELELTLRARITGAELAKAKIQELQKMLAVAQTDEEKASIKSAIRQWEKYAVSLDATQTSGQRAVGMMENLASIANAASGVVDEGAAGWLTWGANVLSAVAAALPAIATVIGGNIAQAFAGAIAQSQDVPFPYNLISLAASVAAVGAAVAAIPKYAEGAIAKGATLGIFGEYPGAQNNPEVVAPLSKLEQYLQPASFGGDVRFRIRGRDLEGLLEKEQQINRRTR